VSSRTSSAGRAAIAAAIAKRALRRDVAPEAGLFLDDYRFETDPALLRPLAAAFAGLAFDEPPTPELLAVVDLHEGGPEALAEVGVRLLALFDRSAFAPQRP
jgi:hypothetical protein